CRTPARTPSPHRAWLSAWAPAVPCPPPTRSSPRTSCKPCTSWRSRRLRRVLPAARCRRARAA
ncbi:MAG: hypothetical protein AVDCRST_MAG77-58, partial [uncultured Chloroflexi bacterium]